MNLFHKDFLLIERSISIDIDGEVDLNHRKIYSSIRFSHWKSRFESKESFEFVDSIELNSIDFENNPVGK